MKYYKEDVKLGDFIDTQKGYAFKSKWYTDEGTQIVKVSDFTADSVDISELVKIPTDIAEKYKKYQLFTDDVIVQTVGSWPSNPASVVGKVVKVPSDANNTLLNQNAVKIIPNEEINKRYLFYFLKSPKFKEYIVGTAQGAASQASITLDSIREFKFNLPHKSTQQKIASILSAFYDLIENNSRGIEILEEIARRIYREWFVHFRYPGHEKDELVDSGTELGEVPERWEVKSFNEIADVLSGGTPKTKVNEYWDGDLPFFSPKDATDNFFVHETSRTVSQKGVDNCASKLYSPKTIFITARGTVGKLNMPLVPMAMNQSCYALKAKDGLGQYFIFFSIENLVKSLQKKAHGAVFDTIIMDTFKEIYSIFPPLDMAKDFEQKVKPLLGQIQVLLKKNERLRETRDLLLPKLISGKINVREITVN